MVKLLECGDISNLSNKIPEAGGRKEEDLSKLFFHMFFDILFLVLAAEVLFRLTVHVLSEPDVIIRSLPSIPLPIEIYIKDFNVYDETVYAMLFVACLLILYLVVGVISATKQGKNVSSTPKLEETFKVLIFFLLSGSLYVLIKFDAKTNILWGFVFSLIYIYSLHKYAIGEINLNIDDRKSFSDIHAFFYIYFIIFFLCIVVFFPIPPEGLNIFFMRRLLLLLVMFTLACYMISEFLKSIAEKASPYQRIFSSTRAETLFHPMSLIIIVVLFLIVIKKGETEPYIGIASLLLIAIVILIGTYMGDGIMKIMLDRIKHNFVVLMQKYVIRNSWNIGVFICSLFFYGIICLFLLTIKKSETESYSGVVTLLLLAILISIGFSLCGYAVNRIVEKNKEILRLLRMDLGKKDKEILNLDKKEIKKIDLMKKLGDYTSTLILNFLIAVSSYIFLNALLKTFLPNSLLLPDLNLILFIPLYLFFFRAGSAIAENVYRELYEFIEEKSKISHDEKREESFVKVLVTLTEVTIVILIVFHSLKRFEIFGAIRNLVSTPPFSYLIELAIGVPTTMRVLLLVLDPFFEKETIEVGSNTGRIKDVGYFFTKMETMTGENVYIPNAELMTRTIRRLNARVPQERKGRKKEEIQDEDKEMGVVIHFSCTLSYDYKPEDIQGWFKELFADKNVSNRERKKSKRKPEKVHENKDGGMNNKEELSNYLKEIGYCDAISQINFIFSENSHPFVFIEDFKDHGIVYRFNFRVRNALYAPIFRGYFMEKFKERMDREKMNIYTPMKHEITDIFSEKRKKIGLL